jgi:hypothetical protein
MRAFDARCHACDDMHIVWVAWDHEVGDKVRIAHARCASACGEYGDHTLVNNLTGFSDHEKWGPPKHDADEMIH